jgi:hypothetical protein
VTAERCEGTLNDSSDAEFITTIKPLLEECTPTLELFEQTIKKLDMCSDLKTWNKAKVHVKSFLYETSLEEMNNTVERYV